ncbi:MAG: hypothetical protein IKS34_00580, partial [Clostridia bacterium]|nr:hypothetical protein [Clostridia bacterium]
MANSNKSAAVLRTVSLALSILMIIVCVSFSLSQQEPALLAEARTSKDVDKEIAECEKLIQSL